MSKAIEIQESKDLSGDPYYDNIIILEGGATLSFCVNNNQTHEEDKGFVLFSLTQQGEPANIDTYFGMPRDMAREFAEKILEITK